MNSAFQAKLLDQCLEGFFIGLLEIIHEFLSLGNHLEQSAAGMEILLVLLEVSGQLLDPFREKGDLVFRRTGILVVPLHFLGDLFLLLRVERHSFFGRTRAGITPRQVFANWFIARSYSKGRVLSSSRSARREILVVLEWRKL